MMAADDLKSDAEVLIEKETSLFERLGGEKSLTMMLMSFFDEFLETPELQQFFCNAPTQALKDHQLKFFKCVFGPKESCPSADDLKIYMISIHARLFREMGLNASHFDVVAKCFVQTFQSFSIEQSLIDEIVAILLPLRSIFEYGAEVAAKEKDMTDEVRKILPVCTAKNIGTDTPVVLPGALNKSVPTWLALELERISNKKNLRDWTVYLSNRCSSTVDQHLADYMMDIHYVEFEPVMDALVQLALLPDTVDNHDALKDQILFKLRFPRGPKKGPLPRPLFERLVVQFQKTCAAMGVESTVTKNLLVKLRSHSKMFPDIDPPKVGGLTSPHILTVTANVSFEVDASFILSHHGEKDKKKAEMGKRRLRKGMDGNESSTCSASKTTSCSSMSSTHKMKTVLRKIFSRS